MLRAINPFLTHLCHQDDTGIWLDGESPEQCIWKRINRLRDSLGMSIGIGIPLAIGSIITVNTTFKHGIETMTSTKKSVREIKSLRKQERAKNGDRCCRCCRCCRCRW